MGLCLTAVFRPWGKNPTRRGACGLTRPVPKLFSGGGHVREIHGFPAGDRALCARAAPVRASGWSAALAACFCPAFGGGFAAVARVTKTLQVGRIYELLPVTLERDDMVNVGCPYPQAAPGALAAKRLAQQLIGAQVVRPNRQAVPAPPRPALCAAPLHALRLVLCAVAAAHQCRAAWVQAGAQRLTCHACRPA